MSTLEIILFVLFLAFCIYNAIFLIIHPVYTEEELKAMREEKKARKKERKLKKQMEDTYDPIHSYLHPFSYLGM